MLHYRQALRYIGVEESLWRLQDVVLVEKSCAFIRFLTLLVGWPPQITQDPSEQHSEPVIVDVNYHERGEWSVNPNVLNAIPTRDVTLSDGSRIEQKWCATCLIWRNPGLTSMACISLLRIS